MAVTTGVFGVTAPTGAARPAWFPDGLAGWTIDSNLNEQRWRNLPSPFNRALLRIGGSGFVLPTAAVLEAALTTDDIIEFWGILEGQFAPRDNQGNTIDIATHNALHVWIGGHMATAGSPNDPVFFLHHCNIDRLWAKWQVTHSGSGHYPANSTTPQGFEIPIGHRLNDPMWPWVGSEAGYEPLDTGIAGYLHSYSDNPPLRPVDVLDTSSPFLDYNYE
jgi:tyrosinase